MKIAPLLRATKLPNKAVVGKAVRTLSVTTQSGLLRSFCAVTATVLLGSSKGMATSKSSTSASVSTAGCESETGHEGRCAACVR